MAVQSGPDGAHRSSPAVLSHDGRSARGAEVDTRDLFFRRRGHTRAYFR